MGKILFYIRHIWRMILQGKMRILLSSAGIFVAVVPLAAGMILTDSYYNGKMKAVSDMSDTVIIISSVQYDNNIIEEVGKVTDTAPVEDITLGDIKRLFYRDLPGMNALSLGGELHGVSETGRTVATVDEEGLYIPAEAELVSGRHLTLQDTAQCAEVVVIDELTADTLFYGQEAVGQTLVVGNDGNGSYDPETGEYSGNARYAKVVGVVKDSAYSEQQRMRFRKELARIRELPDEDGVFIDGSKINLISAQVPVYCPSSTLRMWYPDEMAHARHYYVYSYETAEEYESAYREICPVAEMLMKAGGASFLNTKEDWIRNYTTRLQYTTKIIHAVTIFLCILSVASIMSVTFLSVKERVPEIGIRKAFGAQRADILFQMIFEAAVTSFFVSVLAVCLSYYGCMAIVPVLSEQLYFKITVHAENAHLIFPVFVGMADAVMSTVIPALYAARIKVTDALRFE